MNINLKFYKTIIFLALSTFFIAEAEASRVFRMFDGPLYFNRCYDQIRATSVLDMTPVNDLESEYDEHHKDIIDTIATQFQRIALNINNEFRDMAIQIEVTYQNLANTRMNMLDEISNDKLSFEKRTEELRKYRESAKFPVNFYNPNNSSSGITKDSPEWQYYQNKCDQDKIIRAANSPSRSNARNVAVNITTNQDTIERERSTNPRSTMLERQRNISQSYCSERDFENGLCDKPSDYPYANLSANTFLNPSGIGELNSVSPFRTQTTYSELEDVISRDYMLSIITPFNVSSPTLNEFENLDKQPFLSLYNNNVAALNLANYSFAIARENRIPTHEIKVDTPSGDIFLPVGFFDNLRYLNYKAISDKTIASINSSNNEKTLLEHMYRANALNAKLNMEIFLQQERIERLEAAILSVSENSPDLINHFNNIR